MKQNKDIDVSKKKEHPQKAVQDWTAYMQISKDEILIKTNSVNFVRLLRF